MVKKAHGDDFIRKVFNDFMSGMTLRSIAIKYGVSERTIYTWSIRRRWGEIRKQFKRDLERSLVNKLITKITENTEQHVDISRIAGRIALEELTEAYKEKRDDRLEIAERTSRLALITANIQKTVMPSGNEEVLNQALEELERFKKAYQAEFDFNEVEDGEQKDPAGG